MQTSLTLADLLLNWLSEQNGKVKQETFRSYSSLIENHLLPSLGGLPIENVTKSAIISTADYWLSHGKKNGRGGLSVKTVWEAIVLIKRCLNGIVPEIDIELKDIKNLQKRREEKTTEVSQPSANQYMLYKDWLKIWLNEKRNYVKETTYSSYTNALFNRIMPVLGGYSLDEINESVLQNAALFWLNHGRNNGEGGLSERTVREDVMIIKSSLKAAAKEGLIQRREMQIIFPAGKQDCKPAALSAENQALYTRAVINSLDSRSAGIIFTLHTGVRIGELCALKWSDIDLSDSSVYIHKTLERVFDKDLDGRGASKIITSSPKTQSSIRTVPLSSFICQILRQIDCNNPKAYLLTNTERYIEPVNYRHFYQSFIKKNNLPYIKFHGLRHTFATRLIENGVDCKTVSELLGHASVNMTMNLYVHPQMEQKRRAVEMIKNL